MDRPECQKLSSLTIALPKKSKDSPETYPETTNWPADNRLLAFAIQLEAKGSERKQNNAMPVPRDCGAVLVLVSSQKKFDD